MDFDHRPRKTPWPNEGKTLSDETGARISAAKKGSIPWNKGKVRG